MVRGTLPLTVTPIKTAKLKDKNYSLFDCAECIFLIKANNSMIWRFGMSTLFSTKKCGHTIIDAQQGLLIIRAEILV